MEVGKKLLLDDCVAAVEAQWLQCVKMEDRTTVDRGENGPGSPAANNGRSGLLKSHKGNKVPLKLGECSCLLASLATTVVFSP